MYGEWIDKPVARWQFFAQNTVVVKPAQEVAVMEHWLNVPERMARVEKETPAEKETHNANDNLKCYVAHHVSRHGFTSAK